MPDDTVDILVRIRSDVAEGRQAAQSVNEFKEGTKKGAEEVEVFNTHGREMHRLIHEVGHVAPEAGLLLRAAFHPANIGMAAMVIVVQQLIEAIKEYRKHLEEAAKAQAELTVAVWEGQRDAAVEATKAATDYTEALAKIATNVDALKERESDEMAVLNATIEARKKLAEAAGDKTHVEAIDAQGERQKLEQLREFGAAEHQATERAKAIFEDAARNRQTGASGGDKAAESAKWLEQHKDDVTKAQLELDAISKAPPRRASARQQEGEFGGVNVQDQMDAQHVLQVGAARHKLEEAKAAQEKATAAVAAHAAAAEALARKEKEAEATLEQATKAERARKQEIETAEHLNKIHEQNRIGVELTKMGYNPNSAAGQTVMRGIEAKEALAHGERLSSAQTHTISLLINAMENSGTTQERIIQILKDLMDTNKSHADKVEELAAVISGLRAQLARLAGQTTH